MPGIQAQCAREMPRRFADPAAGVRFDSKTRLLDQAILLTRQGRFAESETLLARGASTSARRRRRAQRAGRGGLAAGSPGRGRGDFPPGMRDPARRFPDPEQPGARPLRPRADRRGRRLLPPGTPVPARYVRRADEPGDRALRPGQARRGHGVVPGRPRSSGPTRPRSCKTSR